MYLKKARDLIGLSAIGSAPLAGGLGSFSVRLSGVILSFIVTVVLARLLGAESYGTYAFVYAFLSLLAIPSGMGLPSLIVRETAKAHASRSWGLMRGLWRWSNLSVFFLSAALLVFVFAVINFWNTDFDATTVDTIYVGLVFVPLVALGNIRGASLRGLRCVVQGQLPETVIRPALFILMLLSFNLLAERDLSATSSMALFTIASMLAFVFGAWMLRRSLPAPMRCRPAPEYDAPYWLKAILPFALIAGMNTINSNADVLLLGLLQADEEAGLYKVASSSAALMNFGMSAIAVAFAPYFARYYQAGDRKALQRLVMISARLGTLVALPVFLIFVFLGEWLLAVFFGSEFSAGWAALVILGFGNFINVGIGPVAVLLNMSGYERETAKGVIIAAVINVLANLCLIPEFGMEGAACATVSSLIFWNVYLWRSTRRNLGITSGIFVRK